MFDKPQAERLVRLQKETWNAWYTGELSRAHGGQLASEVSAEELAVEWTISGNLNGEGFTLRFIQQTSVFSEIEK